MAVSIPDNLFDSAETLSKRLRLTRSGLYATALAEFLAKHRGRKATARLDAVHGAEESQAVGGRPDATAGSESRPYLACW